MNIQEIISKEVTRVFLLLGIQKKNNVKIKQTKNFFFGNYQINGIIDVAKQINIDPIKLATKIVNNLKLTNIADNLNITETGYINIFLKKEWISKQILVALSSSRLGISKVIPQKILVDYSGPNAAKEMHVGHLRSTIIGDAIVRILTFLGHNVIKANHIGDWGSQFGMLIAYIEDIKNNKEKKIDISNLELLYNKSKEKYKENKEFNERAKNYIVKLHNNDKFCRIIWKKIVDISIKNNQKIYNRLNVTLNENDVMGESLYYKILPNIVNDLKKKKIACNIDGATVVVLNEFKNKNGKSMGVIIQKKDGSYLYSTIDIACAKYRYEKFKINRIIYCTDSRQNQHFIQIWTILHKAGYIPNSVLLEHSMFGMVLNKNKKPFKTREGYTFKLVDLLDKALEKAHDIIISKKNKINFNELKNISEIISVGAIKYADLSKNRLKNYTFDLENMLNFDGNTAPYIQYAYTRIISVLKKYNYKNYNNSEQIYLTTIYELKLAIHLLQLEEIIIISAKNNTPHILCDYLYNLAVLFSSFYENCSILNKKNNKIHQSRIKLSLLTALTLKKGLNLLGIKIVKKM